MLPGQGRLDAVLETVAAVAGSKARLDELYSLYAPGALKVAYLITRDQQLAEDITQEAFVKLSAHLADLRNPDAGQAYLRRTVVNLCASHFRRVGLERAYVDLECRKRAWGDQEMPDVERRDELRRALGKLPARQAAAIVLRYYGDLTERQTADAMGVSVGAVKSLVSRGMGCLREHLVPSPGVPRASTRESEYPLRNSA